MLPDVRCLSTYMLLALKSQSGSYGQLRQFVASPAASGFLSFLKNFLDPVEVRKDGRCGSAFVLGGGEHSIHRMKSISWQDFVNSDGAVVDSFRQFPLSTD